MVRDVASSPEELRGLLDLIRAAQEPPQTNTIKQEE